MYNGDYMRSSSSWELSDDEVRRVRNAFLDFVKDPSYKNFALLHQRVSFTEKCPCRASRNTLIPKDSAGSYLCRNCPLKLRLTNIDLCAALFTPWEAPENGDSSNTWITQQGVITLAICAFAEGFEE